MILFWMSALPPGIFVKRKLVQLLWGIEGWGACYDWAGLHNLWQPGSEKVEGEWENEEGMEREWGNGEIFTLYIFIGPESDHWECLSVTHWLTDSLPFSKLDWCDSGVWRCLLQTQGCYCCWCWWWGLCWQFSLLQIWKLRFVQKSKLLFRLWALWSSFWSWSSGEILKLKFGQYFAADV